MIFINLNLIPTDTKTTTMAAEAQADTCAICVEPFNRTVRKVVSCENCQTDICSKCIKRFLAETLQEPNCMQCRELYTNEFMDNWFSVNYRRQALRNVREIILVEREKQHLPELMHRADALKKSNQIMREIHELAREASQMRKEFRKVDDYIQHIQDTMTFPVDDDTTKTLTLSFQKRTEFNKLLKEYGKKEDALYTQKSKYYEVYRHGGTVKINAVIPCINGSCKGFLNNDFVCGLCETCVCPDCLEIKGEAHVCLQENIDSVKAIEIETRPCPTCHTRIFKTDGCDQMFCMHCHTAFSWDTGRIERGRIHNPHYFEWIKKQKTSMPREMGDVPCGGLPMLFQVQQHIDSINVSISNYIYLGAIFKMADFIQQKEVRKYPVTMGREEELNFASIEYLAGIITERRWRGVLGTLEKKKEINTEKRLILDMLIAVLTDYFRGIFEMTQPEQVAVMLDEIEELRQYYNVCIDNLRQRFDNYNFKKISKDWSKLVY